MTSETAQERRTRHGWPRIHPTTLGRGWAESAACVDAPEEDWIPELRTGQRLQPRHYELARTYCRTCPIQRNCKRFGLETKSIGIWGGWYISNTHRVNLLSDGPS